jgi:hypothetical protein
LLPVYAKTFACTVGTVVSRRALRALLSVDTKAFAGAVVAGRALRTLLSIDAKPLAGAVCALRTSLSVDTKPLTSAVVTGRTLLSVDTKPFAGAIVTGTRAVVALYGTVSRIARAVFPVVPIAAVSPVSSVTSIPAAAASTILDVAFAVVVLVLFVQVTFAVFVQVPAVNTVGAIVAGTRAVGAMFGFANTRVSLSTAAASTVFGVALAVVVLVFFVQVTLAVFVQVPTVSTVDTIVSAFSGWTRSSAAPSTIFHITLAVVVLVLVVQIAFAVFVQVPAVDAIGAIVTVSVTLFGFTNTGVTRTTATASTVVDITLAVVVLVLFVQVALAVFVQVPAVSAVGAIVARALTVVTLYDTVSWVTDSVLSVLSILSILPVLSILSVLSILPVLAILSVLSVLPVVPRSTGSASTILDVALAVIVLVLVVQVALAVFIQVPAVGAVGAIVARSGLVLATLFEFTELGVYINVLNDNLLRTELVHTYGSARKLFAFRAFLGVGTFLGVSSNTVRRDQKEEKEKHLPGTPFSLCFFSRSFILLITQRLDKNSVLGSDTAFFLFHLLSPLLERGGKGKEGMDEQEDELVYRSFRPIGAFVGQGGTLGPIPVECRRYLFPMGKLGFPPGKAMRVIRMLNKQRELGPGTPRPTRSAVNTVLLGMGLTNHIRVVFHSRPFRPKRPKHRGDIILTASTDGRLLNIYTGIIRSASFQRKPGFLGIKRPHWVSHYAAVILHELGHIIHKKLRRGGPRAEDVLRRLEAPDCVLDPSQFRSRGDWAEWFADKFSTAFILHARRALRL